MLRLTLALSICIATHAAAQGRPAGASQASKPIQDNSFLLEEAYNQEAGVVQHINSLVFDRNVHTWVYAFTDEWPLNGQRHQLSLTVPLQNSPDGGVAALSDIAINYRLQMIGSGETRLAVTPRLSVILPTASDKLGGGTFGIQGALASSYMATPTLALHSNAGFTFVPSVETGAGYTARLMHLNAGQSALWLVHPRVNLMLEGVVTSTESFTGVGTARSRSTGLTVAPGVRWSHDFASGLQIVPGLAFPIGFRANDGQRGVLLYLSFEHDMPGLKR
ncbi:MAG TPA: hypothetical protein VFT29_11885 [Gemmatimonadaceae bacterium]|nr:hypothetical protein [Gemmatimonadaceae bacterium]